MSVCWLEIWLEYTFIEMPTCFLHSTIDILRQAVTMVMPFFFTVIVFFVVFFFFFATVWRQLDDVSGMVKVNGRTRIFFVMCFIFLGSWNENEKNKDMSKQRQNSKWDITQWGKLPKSSLKELIRHSKYTPTDCFFGDWTWPFVILFFLNV